jgi:hypothetical protein
MHFVVLAAVVVATREHKRFGSKTSASAHIQ